MKHVYIFHNLYSVRVQFCRSDGTRKDYPDKSENVSLASLERIAFVASTQPSKYRISLMYNETAAPAIAIHEL